MSFDILVTRRGQTLVPHDELSAELIEDKFKSGVAMVTIQGKRSVPFDRLYRACLASICASGGHDDGPDNLHKLTKIHCGVVEVAQINGVTFHIAGSIAHLKMKRPEFNEFFDKAINWWRECGLYNWIKPELREKLERGER